MQINPDIPVIALLPPLLQKCRVILSRILDCVKPNIFISSFNRPNLYYEIQPKIKKKPDDESIVRFIKK